jgi:hypothetical protein
MKEKQTDNYVVLAGGMLLLFGFAVLFYELFLWSQHGAWHSLPLSLGLKVIGIDELSTGHTDSQKVVDWLTSSPLCLWFIIPGAAIMIFGQMIRAVKVSR